MQVLSVEEQASLVGGFHDACTRGQLHGYPVSGLDVHVEGVRRDNDTTSGALRACSVQALRQVQRLVNNYIHIYIHIYVDT